MLKQILIFKSRYLKKIKNLYFLFLLSFGCVSTYYDRTEKFTFSWKIGDLDSASVEAEKLSVDGPSRDRLLYQLEEATIKRMKGDIDGSIHSFNKVSDEYARWFGAHLKTEKKICMSDLNPDFSVWKSVALPAEQKPLVVNGCLDWHGPDVYIALSCRKTKAHKIFKNKLGHIFEYGFGSGCNTEHLLKKGYKVTGIDVSNNAIKFSKQRLKKYGKKVKLFKLLKNSKKLPFKKDSFDYIVAMSVLSLLGSEKKKWGASFE